MGSGSSCTNTLQIKNCFRARLLQTGGNRCSFVVAVHAPSPHPILPPKAEKEISKTLAKIFSNYINPILLFSLPFGERIGEGLLFHNLLYFRGRHIRISHSYSPYGYSSKIFKCFFTDGFIA